MFKEHLCRTGRFLIQGISTSFNRNSETLRQSLAVDNHQFGPAIRGWHMKHTDHGSVMRQRNVPFRKQLYHGGAVRSFIIQHQGSKIGKALHVIVEWKIAHLGRRHRSIVISEVVGRQEMFELYQQKLLRNVLASRPSKNVLFGLGVSMEIQSLLTHE